MKLDLEIQPYGHFIILSFFNFAHPFQVLYIIFTVLALIIFGIMELIMQQSAVEVS